MSRQYRNTAQWLELIEAFERSGQIQVEFYAALKRLFAFEGVRKTGLAEQGVGVLIKCMFLHKQKLSPW